jgi:hypothetical protein
MTAQTKTIDDYVAKMQRKLLEDYPDLEFKISPERDDEVYLYVYLNDPNLDWFQVTKKVSGIAVDALVDHDFKIRLMEGNREYEKLLEEQRTSTGRFSSAS